MEFELKFSTPGKLMEFEIKNLKAPKSDWIICYMSEVTEKSLNPG